MAVKVFSCPGYCGSDSSSSLSGRCPHFPIVDWGISKQRTLHSSGNLIGRLEARKRQLRRRELWGVSRALQANVRPGVAATSLPASSLGCSGPGGARPLSRRRSPHHEAWDTIPTAPPLCIFLHDHPSCLLFGDDFWRGYRRRKESLSFFFFFLSSIIQ